MMTDRYRDEVRKRLLGSIAEAEDKLRQLEAGREVLLPGTKALVVYSIRESKAAKVWVKAGRAFINRDGTILVDLDVLPLDGRLQLRELGQDPVELEAAAQDLREAFP